MKKLLCLFVIVVLALIVCVACGDTETTAAPETTTEPNANVTTTGPDTNVTTGTSPVSTDGQQTIEPVEMPEIDKNSINLFEVTENFVRNIAIESKHASLLYHPALVFSLDGDVEVYQDILGNEYDDADAWVNSHYLWVLDVNGKQVIPERFSVYAGSEWGYFRCDLGPKENYEYVKNRCEYSIKLRIINVDTWTVAYYADFAEEKGVLSHRAGYAEADNKPEDISPIRNVTCVSGPAMGQNEGAQRAFDNDFQTKLCTTDNDTPIVVFLGTERTLRGISLVNANDSERTKRVVVDFEVWVSEDGESWDTAPAWSYRGNAEEREDIDDNYLEIYRDFGKEIKATFVKIVINNGTERYQFCEAVLYETLDPNGGSATLLPLEDTSIDLYTEVSFGNFAIEDKHKFNDYNPSFVFRMTNNEDIYRDILGTEYTSTDDWKNSKYKWILSINGQRFEPAKFSIWTSGRDGYFRCDLGAISNYDAKNGSVYFSFDLFIVDAATGKVVYYALFSQNQSMLIYKIKTIENIGMTEAANKPEDVKAIAGVTALSGPEAGKNEGFAKAFDLHLDTKLCTGDNDTPIVADLGGQKTLKGISLVNASDTPSYSSRVVTSFEVWVSEDGERWGTAAAWSTDGEGVDKNEIKAKHLEVYYGFDTPITASYVKLVINNGAMYQFAEIVFYE